MNLSSLAREIISPADPEAIAIVTHQAGPEGKLPLSADQLCSASSGEIFGWSENAGMGWDPNEMGRKEFLILSMQAGIRGTGARPLALGYSTGQWEIDRIAVQAAHAITRLGAIPFAAFCSEHCDGRMQGNDGMMDSLPYRNDAAIVMRRLIRTLPSRKGVLGVATCDKGLPAMMMAFAGTPGLPCVIVPGGVTLPPTEGEDAGKIQSIPARFALGEVSLEYAQTVTCKGCASSGGACQFLGTAATGQVVGEALGLSVFHSALAPAGQKIWMDLADSSARALIEMEARGLTVKDILTDAAIRNAMIVHAAIGGSMNFLLHLPAIAHAAGLKIPTVDDWNAVNQQVPRIVDALPNGPMNHPTVRVFLAGGTPEVMLKLRHLDLLDLNVLTVTGDRLGDLLDQWEASPRRARVRQLLQERDHVDPDDVIMDPDRARKKGLTSTVTFPRGNLAPGGSVIKSTAIDPSVRDAKGVYHKVGPAKVFLTEKAAMTAIKTGSIKPGDIMLLICDGPMGSGMEETYQVTAALKHLPWGKQVALITDARFSGVSTGACVGHVAPEALAGGPIGKVLDGDLIEVMINTRTLEGGINLVGQQGDAPEVCSVERGNQLMADRLPRPDLAPRATLPDDTRLWAALQEVCGGTWGGCVYDTDRIIEVLRAGIEKLDGK